MIRIPAQLPGRYTAFIGHKGVPPSTQQYYVKLLRYYLDFCHKYNLQQSATKSLSAFGSKLKVERKETKRKAAKTGRAAVSFCYEMLLNSKKKVPENFSQGNGAGKSSLFIAQPSYTQQTTFWKENQADDAALGKAGPVGRLSSLLGY